MPDLNKRAIEVHRALLSRALDSLPAMPPKAPHGRGIVTAIGGAFIAAGWVLLTLLRDVHRCRLPIEVWYLNDADFPAHLRALFNRFEVRFVDAARQRPALPAGLGGWEMKTFATLHSSFAEVLFLDADNAPLRDPTPLFDWPSYRQFGAVVWPDLQLVNPYNPLWWAIRPLRDGERQWESGQILLDKRRTWRALHLAASLNEQSDFYFRFVQGDKETLHLAWRALGAPFSMPSSVPAIACGSYDDAPRAEAVRVGLWQHDFLGTPLFLHRTDASWVAHGRNPRCSDFGLHDVCLSALEELRQHWDGFLESRPSPASRELKLRRGEPQSFFYARQDLESRQLDLEPGGRIATGARRSERFWRVDEDGGKRSLVLSSRWEDTCRLQRDSGGAWRGRWIGYEQTPVELIPIDSNRDARAGVSSNRRRSLLYITPVMPAERGNGLAMRAAKTLGKLCDIYDVSLLIIPLYPPGSTPNLPDWAARRCVAIRLVPPPIGPEQRSQNLSDPALFSEWCAAAGRAYAGERFDLIHLFRWATLPFADGYVRDSDNQAADWHIDLDDVESRSAARLADLYQRHRLSAQQAAAQQHARNAMLAEHDLLRTWDRIYVCSEQDRAYLESEVPGRRAEVVVLPNVVELPAAPPPARRTPPLTILFVGTFDYFPNTDAAIWLCREIVPVLRELTPVPLRVLLVGTGGGEALKRLGDIPEIAVVGPVPEMGPWYAQADLVVVPLRAGGGTRLKLLEALSYKRPVVSTTIGAEGLEAMDGEHLLLADRANHFAKQCLRLLVQPELASRLAEQGRGLVEARYTRAALSDPLGP